VSTFLFERKKNFLFNELEFWNKITEPKKNEKILWMKGMLPHNVNITHLSNFIPDPKGKMKRYLQNMKMRMSETCLDSWINEKIYRLSKEGAKEDEKNNQSSWKTISLRKVINLVIKNQIAHFVKSKKTFSLTASTEQESFP
jgi:hypothetical protein